MEIKPAEWPRGTRREPDKAILAALKSSLDKASRTDDGRIDTAPALSVTVPADKARQIETEIRLAGTALGCGVGISKKADGKNVTIIFRAQNKRQRRG